MPYIYSTLSNPQSVVVYEAYPGANDDNHKKGSSNASVRQGVIHINGGANVIERNLITPMGVRTEVTEDQLTALRKQSCFRNWEKAKFITVEDVLADPDEVAEDMVERDNSAQITTGDHEKRFEAGDTSADVVVDDPKPRGKVRKTRKPAPKANEE